jgi:hypothetical protein
MARKTEGHVRGAGIYSGTKGDLNPRPPAPGNPMRTDNAGNPTAPNRDLSRIVDRNADRHGGFSNPLDKGD